MSKQKYFILDTNVLLHNPNSLCSFGENFVIIPIYVIEELDQFKKYHDERGRNARSVIRMIDGLRSKGNLGDGVPLESGGVIKIITLIDLPAEKYKNLTLDKVDNKIILFIKRLQELEKERDIYFISKDIHARIKADALGIKSEDYEKQKVNIDTLYTGYTECPVPRECIDQLFSKGSLTLDKYTLINNQYAVLVDETDPSHTALCRFNAQTGSCRAVNGSFSAVWGIKPRNLQQRIAFDLLLDDSVSLVTLVGTAGTGKTLLALACGLRKVFDDRKFQRLLVSRPLIPFGQDIGFLPGSKSQKIQNWMQPIFDNLEYILEGYKASRQKKIVDVDYLLNTRFLELEPLTYMRGRSIPCQYIIIDEAQNLTPQEVKTIITRAGDRTKMILTGDPYQIDSPYLDASSNGLSYVVELLKGIKEYGHITLQKSERSNLASIAAKLL